MNIAQSREQRDRIVALHADLRRNIEIMDKLGFVIAANYVDQAAAIINAEIAPDSCLI